MAASVGRAIALGAARLTALAEASPRLEAERLLSLAAGLTRAEILTSPERSLCAGALTRYTNLLRRRATGEPFAYLCGRKPFWTLELQVTPDTLIPRPETELLVELALAQLPAAAPLRVADLGTGSGALAAALANERPAWRLLASDRCPAALAVARTNLEALAGDRVALVGGDWLAPFGRNTLDAVLSNPPYVRDADPCLQRGALRFEPRQALAAGRDGLAAIRQIVATAPTALRPGGLLALEHGHDQGPEVRQRLAHAGFRGIATRRDLAGHERVSYGHRPGP